MFAQVLGSTIAGETPILFEQYIKGVTLESLDTNPNFTYQEFYELFVYLVERYIAFPNYNHRDLHLGNIILIDTQKPTHRYKPKLIDFAFSYLMLPNKQWIVSSRGFTMPDRYIPLIDLYRVLCKVCYNHGWDSPLLNFFGITLKDLSNVRLSRWMIPEIYWDKPVSDFYEFIQQTVDKNQTMFATKSRTLTIGRMRFPDYFEFPDDGVFFKEVYPTLKNDYLLKELTKNSISPSFNNIVSVQQEEHSAIKRYSHKYDGPINTNLRTNNTTTEVYTLINEIIEAIKRQKFIDPFIAYRGVKPWKDFSIGDRLSDPGFMSKSWSLDEAVRFTGRTCCIFICWYPIKTQQLFMESISLHEGEHELISFPSERWEVVDVGSVDAVIESEIESESEDTKTIIISKKAFLLKYIGNNELDIFADTSLDKKVNKAFKNFRTQFEESSLHSNFQTAVVVFSKNGKGISYMTNGPLREAIEDIIKSAVVVRIENFEDFKVQCLRGDFDNIYVVDFSKSFGAITYYVLGAKSASNFDIVYEEIDQGIQYVHKIRTAHDCFKLIVSSLQLKVDQLYINGENATPIPEYIFK